MAEIAAELKRRARPEYLREQARGAVIRKTTELKVQTIRNPIIMGAAGAIVGSVAAKVIRSTDTKHRRQRIEWEPAGGMETEGMDGMDKDHDNDSGNGITQRVKAGAAQLTDGIKEKARGLKDKAVEVKDQAVEAAGQAKASVEDAVAAARDKLPSVDQVKEGASSAYRWTTEEQPIVGGLIAVGIGMALGFLLPVSNPEKKAMASVKQLASENLGTIETKVRELGEKLEDRIAGDRQSSLPA